MSWAQHDNALQKTVTFTDKKKIAYNYSDPGGSTEKFSKLKPFIAAMKNFTFQKRSKKKRSCITGQIMPTRNNDCRKSICVSQPLSVK